MKNKKEKISIVVPCYYNEKRNVDNNYTKMYFVFIQ